MRRRRSAAASPLNVLTLAVGAMLAGAGDADAMDCSRASTSAEWTICGDKNLLLLDRDLTIVYHKFIKVFSDTRHYTHLVAETRTGQKEWLRKRNACGTDAACIRAAHENASRFCRVMSVIRETTAQFTKSRLRCRSLCHNRLLSQSSRRELRLIAPRLIRWTGRFSR